MLVLLKNTWPLLLGILLLMLGNGMQGTLLGVRGAIEGFSPVAMSLVMSGYFLGFLISSRATPTLIRRVGHVRVFAAMASIISAVFILYAALPNVWAWGLMRVVAGACFASVYVVAESWLNDGATNETRGQALSVYMAMQLLGVIAAQGLVNLGDPAGYSLFVLVSVLVSLSFAPILLSVSPVPMHAAAKPMSLGTLFRVSPLGVVGTVFLGAVFSAILGMAAVYGTERGLSVGQISLFVSAIYLGGLVAQFPLGWVSDRMDRRRLILLACAAGAAASVLGAATGGSFPAALAAAFVIGGVANPLYSLLVAHTNDFLEADDMPAASSGLIFLNGVGAIGGPLVVGGLMAAFGPWSFFGFIAAMFAAIALYAAWRATQRPAVAVEDTGAFAAVSPQATAVVLTAAAEYAAEQAEAAEAESEAAESEAAEADAAEAPPSEAA